MATKKAKFKRSHIQRHQSMLFRNNPKAGWLRIRFDGGCENNGRHDATGTYGFTLTLPDNECFRHSGTAIGEPMTNNVAEWTALHGALIMALCLPNSPSGILIEGDSKLVIEVLKGKWGSKAPHLTVYRDKCLSLLKAINVQWHARWIPRSENAECDALAAESTTPPHKA